jgi:hypothetical protein
MLDLTASLGRLPAPAKIRQGPCGWVVDKVWCQPEWLSGGSRRSRITWIQSVSIKSITFYTISLFYFSIPVTSFLDWYQPDFLWRWRWGWRRWRWRWRWRWRCRSRMTSMDANLRPFLCELLRGILSINRRLILINPSFSSKTPHTVRKW